MYMMYYTFFLFCFLVRCLFKMQCHFSGYISRYILANVLIIVSIVYIFAISTVFLYFYKTNTLSFYIILDTPSPSENHSYTNIWKEFEYIYPYSTESSPSTFRPGSGSHTTSSNNNTIICNFWVQRIFCHNTQDYSE